MILSTAWLADYVQLPAATDELVERLLMSGLNHESTQAVGADTAVEIEVTSNRPDCLGHIGVAREVAVLFGRPLHLPDPPDSRCRQRQQRRRCDELRDARDRPAAACVRPGYASRRHDHRPSGRRR
jgi:phenylalanyl-tRNA synthetase beta subunit